MSERTASHINRLIEHSLLRPDTVAADLEAACLIAIEHDLYALVVNPSHVTAVNALLEDTNVIPISVTGFPLGCNRTEVKTQESLLAVRDGAREIDMVANIGWLASGEYDRVVDEIRQVRDSLPYNVVLKVIIEANLLTADQQRKATRAVVAGGAQFVKTGTGFNGGTSPDQVRRLVEAAAGEIEVKASGGIKSVNDCRLLIEAGATRLGTSSSDMIMKEYQRDQG